MGTSTPLLVAAYHKALILFYLTYEDDRRLLYTS